MTISRGQLTALIMILFAGIAIFAGYSGYKYITGGISTQDKDRIVSEVDAFTQNILSDLQSSESASDSGAVSTTQPDLPKIEAVKADYQSGLLSLQMEANAMVDRLIASVIEDYTALQASGQDTAATASLALSALQKAQVLEAQVDSGFDLILSGMSAELTAANMPKEELISYEEELRVIYEEQKKQRKDAIMDKAKDYL